MFGVGEYVVAMWIAWLLSTGTVEEPPVIINITIEIDGEMHERQVKIDK